MQVYAERCDKLQIKKCRSLGKDLNERSYNGGPPPRRRVVVDDDDDEEEDEVFVSRISHTGIGQIDLLVFYKLFFADLKSKKLKSLLANFYENEDHESLRETLVKERDSVNHKDPLIRQFCQVLSQDFLINDKQDVHFSQIAPMFFSKDRDTVQKLLKYNITDVFQTCRLATTHNIVLSTLAFAFVFEITPNTFYTQGTEIRCMSRMWREIFQIGMVYNDYADHPEEDPRLYSEPQDGAVVQDPDEGIYDNAALIDVASMYPSLIMEYGLCKSTMIEKRFLCDQDIVDLHRDYDSREYRVQGRDVVVVDGRKGEEQKESFYVRFEKSLKEERAKYKALAAKCKAEGDMVMAELYGAYEKAVKVLMNALYGINGQQGTNVTSLADILNPKNTREDAARRLQLYWAVVKQNARRSGGNEIKLTEFYTRLAENVQSMLNLKKGEDKSLFLQRECALRNEAMKYRIKGGYWHFFPLGALICYLGRRIHHGNQVFGDALARVPRHPLPIW